jgi:hypothetical protein
MSSILACNFYRWNRRAILIKKTTEKEGKPLTIIAPTGSIHPAK